MGPIIGSHTGPGLVATFFHGKTRSNQLTSLNKNQADELQKEVKELKRYKGLFENCRKLYFDLKEQAHSMCEKLEDLEDSLKRTTCQAECYKHKEADRYRALLGEVVMYCEEQDLKNDITACNVINMIEKEGI